MNTKIESGKIELSDDAPIGDIIDNLYTIRAERLVLNKQVEGMKRNESDIVKQIQERLNQAGLVGATGSISTASQYKDTVCKMLDWDAFIAWVVEGGHFHLLSKSVSAPGYREFLALGMEVPGTEPLDIAKLSITRSKK